MKCLDRNSYDRSKCNDVSSPANPGYILRALIHFNFRQFFQAVSDSLSLLRRCCTDKFLIGVDAVSGLQSELGK